MNKTSQLQIDLANNTQWAECRSERTEMCKLSHLWQSTLENQACYISEFTNSVLAQMVRSRELMAEQVKQVSEYTEHVILTMANTACRAAAIALHARSECHDRRVLPLRTPANRRFETEFDRRLFTSSDKKVA